MHLIATVRDRGTLAVTALEADAPTYDAAKSDVDARVPSGSLVIAYRVVGS